MRVTSTATPPISVLRARKYRTSAQSSPVAAFSVSRDNGPCMASAAVDSLTSCTSTSRPPAFIVIQRQTGCAAVQRNVVSPIRVTVPSSTTLPRSSHHGVYSTCPTASFLASRVTMRSTSSAASGPDTRYL